jgi:hypothetical protein
MNRIVRDTRLLVAAALVALVSSLAVVCAAVAGTPLTTTITHATIHPAAHHARFAFDVSGGKPPIAVEFFCGLVRHGYVAGPPRQCSSPNGYEKLAKGRYTFSVYAQETNGHNTNIATDDFQIP